MVIICNCELGGFVIEGLLGVVVVVEFEEVEMWV